MTQNAQLSMEQSEAWTFLRSQKMDPAFMSGYGAEPDSLLDALSWLSGSRSGSRCDDARSGYIRKFGFAIPSDAAMEVIAKYAPIVEVGAGSGYWSYEAKRRGIDIVPTDPGTGCYGFDDRNHWIKRAACWLDIEPLFGVQAIERYPDRNLLTVWPDHQNDWPCDTLYKFTGRFVIYVGEGRGGCTGDDAFHDLLNARFEEIQEIDIPQFYGLHDNLTVWERNK